MDPAQRLVVDWPGGTVLSAFTTVEEGARAAALFAPGMFRIDVTPRRDTLRIQIRNLSPVPVIAMPPETDRRVISQGTQIEATPGQPSRRHDVRFDLGTDFEIRAVVTTLGIRDQGLIQVLGQALITPGSRRRPVI
jgi:hypothetical protein